MKCKHFVFVPKTVPSLPPNTKFKNTLLFLNLVFGAGVKYQPEFKNSLKKSS